ncbi:MAG: hypothetical protein M3335_02140 [Actinomycetota bacterium]|nr:hypothetical protein [Actinomycetota bacterium]
MRQGVKEDEQVYRSGGNTVAAVVWLVISNGFAISFVIRAPDSPPIIVLAGLYAAVSSFLFARLFFAGIFTSPRGIRVANIFKSFDLRWDEIQRFEMGRWKVIPRTCLIHLRDGRIKHAAGVEESANFPSGSAEKMVEELNDELSRRVGQVDSAQGSSG